MGFFSWLKRLVNPPVFVVLLHEGHATAEKGNLSVKFLTECSNLAKKRGIREGRVYGVWKSDAVLLEFSPLGPHHDEMPSDTPPYCRALKCATLQLDDNLAGHSQRILTG